jgi:hypothetical protein
MHRQLIASPYPDGHIVVSPGRDGGIRIGSARYSELRHAHAAALVPSWLAAPARAAWNLDLTDRNIGEAIIIRPETKYGYARASYELNLGCNYDCEHCYLGEKKFAGLDWLGRERLLQVMADAGVLWLQLTGGCFRTRSVPQLMCLVSLSSDEPENRCSGCWDAVPGLPRDGACAGARSLHVAL